MFRRTKPALADDKAEKISLALVQMIDTALASIHFKPDGTILWANQNFLDAMGYSFDEVRAKHHRIFVSEDDAAGPEYQHFWSRLARRDIFTGRFRRIDR